MTQWNQLSIAAIKAQLSKLRSDSTLLEHTLQQLAADPRQGVQLLIQKETRYLKRQKIKQARQATLKQMEDNLQQAGYKLIAGVDEAGRGPLAGPVVAAAVILPDQLLPAIEIYDSKKLTAAARNKAYQVIKQQALAVQVGVVSPQIIDEINILQASLLAMQQAVIKLNPQPDLILVDGNKKIPKILTEQRAIIKGDVKSRVIAAASIVAKVFRDQYMIEMASLYPEFGFEKHKGYPTAAHRASLIKYGPTKIHRKSFLKGCNCE